MNAPPGESDVTSCYRHDTRPTGVICQRCDRPICTDCMNTATVGFHCPECLKTGKQKVFRGTPTFDPIVTKVLIGLSALGYLWSANTPNDSVVFEGGLFGPLVANGEWYRIVSSGFLHSGVLHLAFNMYALWILGGQLERVLSRPRFVTLYFASLLGGSFGVLLLDPLALTVGASGAIFGLFGATMVIQRSAGMNVWTGGLGPVLALNLFITFAIPRISIGGHLGGLATGALLTVMYIALTRAGRTEWYGVATAVALSSGLLAASLWLASNPI